MAALFRMPFTKPTAEPTAPSPSLAKTEATQLPMPKSPRSYRLPAYPDAREWDERQRWTAPAGVSAQRIAHWDKKREKCANCKHIYLKTLSRHAGYCSVDCKSNAVYLDKVNRTIKAVRAVQHQKRQQQEAVAEDECQQQEDASERETLDEDVDDDVEALTQARTFAEFGLDARLPTDQHVSWAFSAMY